MAVYKVYIQARGGKQMEQHRLWYPDVAESRDGRRPGEDGPPATGSQTKSSNSTKKATGSTTTTTTGTAATTNTTPNTTTPSN